MRLRDKTVTGTIVAHSIVAVLLSIRAIINYSSNGGSSLCPVTQSKAACTPSS